jgi:hypothetical protein
MAEPGISMRPMLPSAVSGLPYRSQDALRTPNIHSGHRSTFSNMSYMAVARASLRCSIRYE